MSKQLKQLAKFLSYVLERNPYEFGLVPDMDGFVKMKDLLKAFAEEDGWKHIRQSSIEELVYSMPDAPVEINDNRVRAINRELLQKPVHAGQIPKLLYTCIRNKAHFHVTNKGIHPPQDISYVVMSSEKPIAEKIGKRKDQSPVMLTVNTASAENEGVFFFHAGETIYLAKYIPTGCFSGPPLPSPEEMAKKKQRKKPSAKKSAPEPGSYIPDVSDTAFGVKKKGGKRDKASWKENKKKLRKHKDKFRGEF